MKTVVGHIVLSVGEWDRSRDFYDALMGAMGFEVCIDEGGAWGRVRGYRQGDCEFEISCESGVEHRPFRRHVGLNHVAFRTDSRESVDRIFALVRDLEAPVTRSPRSYPEYSEGYYAFYFRDPDGIPLEVATW